ncbi:MAG TPA: glycosyltransferase family 4 protein [Candidatus Cybelea sp.]|nr:glycosyltransferase family 4 protein [Candidatus Cybelea sp.]
MTEPEKRDKFPKSLAIVTAFYPPAIGGVERYSQEFARTAKALGLSVNVITTTSRSRAETAVEDDGINVLRLPARYVPVSGSYFPIPYSGAKEMSEFLDCDVVMAQTRFFLTTLMAAGIAFAQRRRISIVDHGAGPLRPQPWFLAPAMAYEHAVTAVLRCFSPRFFAVSEASSRWLQHFGIPSAPVISNGISESSTMPVRSRGGFEHPVIFFAGRLLREKGVFELVDAVEYLTREGFDLQLRVGGEGPLSKALEEHSRNSRSLTYLGRLGPEDVANELQRATIFVNPSNLPEGMPTILLEAGRAALPVISTLVGGSAELIEDGRTGWSIERGAAALIAAALQSVVMDPDEAIRRGAALFRLVNSQFTWPAIVQRFLRYCEAEYEVPRVSV